MRVTNKLMADTVAQNLFQHTDRLMKTQEMISSGKKINRPSDDPIGMGKVLDYRSALSTIEQYARNLGQADSWLKQTDSSLGGMNTLLIRAKELAVYQATETASAQTREIAAGEVANLYDQILQLANSKLGNRYIFAGHQTDAAPFTRDADFNVTYSGDAGQIKVIVGENVTLQANTTGEDALINGTNVFDVLRDLRNALDANDTAGISAQVELLDNALEQVLTRRAETGAVLNRLETTKNYWANFNQNLTESLSDTEDADLIKTMTDLTSQEAAYQASLAAAAKVLQVSLLDFLQ